MIFCKYNRSYCAKWTTWATGEQSRTAAGNTRSPGYALAISWLSEIWEAFPSEIIKNSFEHCGITSQTSLHSQLAQITRSNDVINLYVDIFNELDEYLGLDNEEEDEANVFDQGCGLEEDEETSSQVALDESSIIEPEDTMDVDLPSLDEAISDNVCLFKRLINFFI